MQESARPLDVRVKYLVASILAAAFVCALAWTLLFDGVFLPLRHRIDPTSPYPHWVNVVAATVFFATVFAAPAYLVRRCFERWKDAETELRDFAEMSSDWFWVTDAEHRYIRFSRGTGPFDTKLADAALGASRFDFRAPSDRDDEKWRRHQADLDARRPFKDFEYCMRIADHPPRYCRTSGRPIFSRKGKFLGYRGTVVNITAQVEASAKLQQREQEFRALLESAPDAMVIIGADGAIVYVNHQTVALFGHAPRRLVGETIESLMPDRYRAGHRKFRESYFVDPHPRAMGGAIEIFGLTRDGCEIPLEISLSTIDTSGRRLVCAAVRDITERKEAQKRIEFLAHHDALTELPNRALFDDRLDVALRAAKRDGTQVAVIMLDLDMFKEINDTLGHSVGDQVLVEVASRLRECVRDGDTVARFGGDEFSLILPDAAPHEVIEQIADRLLTSLTRPMPVGRETRSIGCSVGIAVFPTDADDGETLVRLADAAMYRAKQSGRGRRYFHDAQTEPVLSLSD